MKKVLSAQYQMLLLSQSLESADSLVSLNSMASPMDNDMSGARHPDPGHQKFKHVLAAV